MKKIIGIFLVLVASQNIFAQSGWVPVQHSITQNKLNAIYFLNPLTGWIGGQSIILKTTNGGINWTSKTISGLINIIHVFDSSNVIFSSTVTGPGGQPYGDIFRSTDGGQSFSLKYQTAFYGIGQLNFLNDMTGWATTYDGPIAKTVNGGFSWYVDGITGGSIDFLDVNTGWLLKYNITSGDTKLLYTTNSGSQWTTYNMSPMSGRINFLNAFTGYVNGTAGIIKSTNGGVNWVSTYNSAQVFNLQFINDNSGWFTKIFPVDGSIMRTKNGGITWYRDTLLSTNMNSIFFVTPYLGWAVGDSGVVYKTTSGGNTSVINTSEIPDKYSLSQNYPNPFNPSTKINYEIKSPGFVSLKVFDLLGKEVATLVNEKQNAGSYAVDFNSSEFNLPSGIYFYTLNAGEFKETKKMVLVK